MFLLSFRIKAVNLGIFTTLHYFVGRNPPTSLARNYSKSEVSNSKEEANYIAYTWWWAGRSISRAPKHKVESLGIGALVKAHSPSPEI